MNNGKLGKPIFKECPRCNVLTQWYWTYEENEFERSLKAVECSCEINPLELGFESYESWKADSNNFYPVKKVIVEDVMRILDMHLFLLVGLMMVLMEFMRI